MKYYSDKTQKLYETPEALETAEAEFDKALEAKKNKEAEKTKRFKEVKEAYEKYVELKNAYLKDYGSFYMTNTYPKGNIDLLSWFFD